jgi:hypothetical protein
MNFFFAPNHNGNGIYSLRFASCEELIEMKPPIAIAITNIPP